jgi:hypothetical protein
LNDSRNIIDLSLSDEQSRLFYDTLCVQKATQEKRHIRYRHGFVHSGRRSRRNTTRGKVNQSQNGDESYEVTTRRCLGEYPNMSDERILYQRTDGHRMYRVVRGDVTHANVKKLFLVELWEDGIYILTTAPFLTIDKAKARIRENINTLRAHKLKCGKKL